MIKKIYAFVCPDTEGTGILSFGHKPKEQMPLIFMNLDIAKARVPQVKKIFSGHGRTVELRAFNIGELIQGVVSEVEAMPEPRGKA